MKELLLQYAKYNVWANKRLIEVITKLEAEHSEKEIVSSFPSVNATAMHIWCAEAIWLQRLNLVEQPVWMENVFTGSFEEALIEWIKTSEGLVAFVEKQFDDRGFEHVLQYYNLQKRPMKLSVFTVLTHALNHSSYHRGQLVTMLRQLGVTKMPSLDLVQYVG
ncbi:DinB family protein [Polluticoccus soli]|uniref:DinB family protein n=1 Tax=Polluticoccus soli TaxID=3034150 RepID=UPI0023E1C9A1|nr:DinB family protein [Flavipsychrobacter sp. JY13-12]